MIRKVGPGDAEVLAGIRTRAVGAVSGSGRQPGEIRVLEAWAQEGRCGALREGLASPDVTIFVAESGGVASGSAVPDGGRIQALHILPEQNQDLVSALVARLKQEARDQGNGRAGASGPEFFRIPSDTAGLERRAGDDTPAGRRRHRRLPGHAQ